MENNASITIKNFKSYKDATLPLSHLTLLIGANASGKSNAIEAFRFLSWVAGGERLSTLKNRVNDSDKVVRGSTRDLAFNETDVFSLVFQTEDGVEYEGIFSVDTSNIALISEILRAYEQKLFIVKSLEDARIPKISKFYTTKLTEKINTAFKENENLLMNDTFAENIAIYKNYDTDTSEFMLADRHTTVIDYLKASENVALIEFVIIRNFLTQSYFYDLIPNSMRNSSVSDDNLRLDGSNLAGVLHHICKKQNKKSQLLEIIKSLPEQDITDIKLYEDHRGRIEFALVESFGGISHERTMDLLSDGTLKVLGLAAALLSVPKRSTVVIEEIDNSIHPTRAHQILSLMRQYAEESSLNLLLSTHNPALMDALPDEALADVVFCYRDPKEGDSRLVRLGDLDNYLGLVAQGSLGDLVTQGIVERFIKHPTTSEQRKQQALSWLNQLQGAD
ncbi:AAA family ATPase [Psychrobacter pacificensis]|uniref:AAA family ATPase n=1 Tax=Psychrobacter pacificensis TaxID=112002 RepID=UPI002E406A64|nr:AAA family ATPase [Pseudomonadota bacterium]